MRWRGTDKCKGQRLLVRAPQVQSFLMGMMVPVRISSDEVLCSQIFEKA
jgi:hypothetical protein